LLPRNRHGCDGARPCAAIAVTYENRAQRLEQHAGDVNKLGLWLRSYVGNPAHGFALEGCQLSVVLGVKVLPCRTMIYD